VFGKRLTGGRCPIGVDIGPGAVRMIQLEQTAAGLRAVAAAAADLPDIGPGDGQAYHDAVADAIAAARAAGGFTTRDCVSALPAAVVQTKNLRLPKMPVTEMQPAIEWEAQERLSIGDEPHSVDFFNSGEVRQGEEVRQEVILLAAPTAFIEAHVAALARGGLRPVAIDAVPAALHRALDRRSVERPADADDAARVILEVGDELANVLISRGGQVLFYKQIDIAGRRFDQTVAEHLRVTPSEARELRSLLEVARADAGPVQSDPDRDPAVQRAVFEALRPAVGELGREIALCMRYYAVTFRGRRPEYAALVGDEAAQPWLPAMLADQAGVTVRPADPLRRVDTTAVRDRVPALASAAAWATVTGLAMRDDRKVIRRGVPAGATRVTGASERRAAA